MVEPHTVEVFTMRTFDAPASTVSVDWLIRQEVEKSSLERAKMEESFLNFAGPVNEKKTKAEDGITTAKMHSIGSPSPIEYIQGQENEL